MRIRSPLGAVVALPFLLIRLGAAEPPADKGPMNGPEVVFRPTAAGKELVFRVPPEAAARLIEIVSRPGSEFFRSFNTGLSGPEGAFVLDGREYSFRAKLGLLQRNLPGDKVAVWYDGTLGRLGENLPRESRWDQEVLARWSAALEKPKGNSETPKVVFRPTTAAGKGLEF